MVFPRWWLPVVSQFVGLLGQLLTQSPSTVSSFIRSRAHNASVGGVSDSQHLIGTAADLVPADGDLDSLEQIARTIGFGFVLNEGDHVHVQLFPARTVPPEVFDLVAA